MRIFGQFYLQLCLGILYLHGISSIVPLIKNSLKLERKNSDYLLNICGKAINLNKLRSPRHHWDRAQKNSSLDGHTIVN